MNAEILAVGTELLLGDIVNTNAQYLSVELAKLGISVFYQSVVGDNAERLTNAYEIAFSRADMVITTGGLGPTEDDLTKEIGSKFFHKKLVLHQPSLDFIENVFSRQNLKMTENNKKQAMFPEGSTILENPKGTAPGCMIEENGKILIMLPGPPSEVVPMYENVVLPILRQKSDGIYLSTTVKICGIGESAVEDKVKDLIDGQTNPTIAPYAKTNEVTLRVTASAKTEKEAKELIIPTIDELYKRLPDFIYGKDDDTLEGVVCKMLMEKNLTIAVAESCTGGMFTSRLVDFPGISNVLKESCITYSNEAKINRLGVTEETLRDFGAVSRETAIEMAEGIAKTGNANIGVSITGVAGPDGGTDEKPVGLVFAAISINGTTECREYHNVGDRQKIRTRVVSNVLYWLWRALKNV